MLLGLVGGITFANAFHQDFVVDDYGILVYQTDFRNPKFILSSNFLPQESSAYRVDYYRPIPHFILTLNYLLFRDHPKGYHLVDLLLLTMSGSLLYAFVRFMGGAGAVALTTALLYVTHPINGVLVNYKTSPGFSLMVALVLAALILEGTAAGLEDPWRRRWKKAFALVCVLGAILSHETLVAYPFYLAGVLYFLGIRDWRRIFGACVPSSLLAAAYLLVRLRWLSLVDHVVAQVPWAKISVLGYLDAFGRIIWWYLSRLVYPWDIVLAWGTPLAEPTAMGLLSLTLLVAAIAGSLWLWRNDLCGLGVLWIVIGFLPVTMACLIEPQYGLVFEPHWVLLSTAGFCLLVAVLISKLAGARSARLRNLLVLLLIVSYLPSSWRHNSLWAQEERYMRFWLGQFPENQRGRFILALNLMRQGRNEEAKPMFHKLLSGRKEDWEVYANLGTMAAGEGDLQVAREYFQRGLRFNERSAVLYNNLGGVLLRTGNREEARASFEQANQWGGWMLEPRLNLAKLSIEDGNYERARQLLDQNLEVDPREERTFLELLRLSWGRQDKSAALQAAQNLLKLGKDPGVLTQAGSLMAEHGYLDFAGAFFSQALFRDPDFADAYLEMGKMLGNQNQFNRAITAWQEGWKKNPRDPRFAELIRQAESLKRQEPAR